jgi:hypothetical protein
VEVGVVRLGVVAVAGVVAVEVVDAGVVVVLGVVDAGAVAVLEVVDAGAVVVLGLGVVAVVAVVAAVVVTAGGVTGAAVVTAAGVVEAGALPSSVSFTKAKASIAPASSTIAAIATVGSCQFGVCASRVRAGAPHSRHQSCSGPTVAEQRGQRREPASGSGGVPGAGGCVLTTARRRSPAASSRRVGRAEDLGRLRVGRGVRVTRPRA